MADSQSPGAGQEPEDRSGRASPASVLVIGRPDDASLAQAQVLGGRMFIVPVNGLTAALMAQLAPDWVIFPLIATGFDAPHVIEILAALGYAGRACVMAPPLPNRRMVEIELRSIAPELNIVLVEAPG